MFYCHKPGHVIANSLALKCKEQQQPPQSVQRPKGIGLIKACVHSDLCNNETPDACFKPFIFDGLVSLNGKPADQRPVLILRDTGGSQSVILSRALLFSEQSACGYGSVLCGIEMGYIPRPVQCVHVQSSNRRCSD